MTQNYNHQWMLVRPNCIADILKATFDYKKSKEENLVVTTSNALRWTKTHISLPAIITNVTLVP